MSPTYSLEKIKKLIAENKCYMTARATEEAWDQFALNEDEAIEEVLDLKTGNFTKSMHSNQKAGLFQDVYKKSISGKDAYIKLQISKQGDAVIISFHEYT
ncbi:type II toxin-antitoxin system MqsR family toxin [Leptospira bourretii]|uniref:Type II toxin-antitoxin system MqsR family toxin n=1 Tax=Leptospira bourretii TaxID=2484962 RepID=A0A4R9ISV9_9LEPT|nr:MULTISPECIES: type II toxin-antitoxin system MqsR family toxin [Leptospira]TGK79216.1 type II toxin-antitoxin system MqsR family toxin [Leptospira bourretii]TGK94325.1 type II toxin-antitoxin system MqsR family toxin [Leptospira bourretii]TGL16818.1 type II toxin-antitoxin system MqsR family toxin [Leptospira levettii]TGL38853.1 type II toxin-antitoxin system MqsR family toxin [Leptospira bourretii]